MKLKNILLSGLSLVLVAALAIGGTVAYLQDDDSDVNVMTLGNVKIEQIELQRVQNDDGTYPTETIGGKSSYKLEAFEQGKMLVPTTEIDANGNPVNFGAGGYQDTVVMFEQLGSYNGMQVFESENAVDKFVFVKNTGNTSAYVRTLIAFEIGSLTLEESKTMVRKSYHGGWNLKEAIEVTIDGKDYAVYEYVYQGFKGTHTDGVLPAGATTPCSLAQVYLNSAATNETVEKLDGNNNGTYDILVLSQAVQADGFANAEIALNAGFGEANAANIQTWFGGDEFEVPVMVSTADELKAAIAAGGSAVLSEDVEMEAATTAPYSNKYGVALNGGVLDGNGNELEIKCYGDDYGIMTTGGTVKNLTIKQGCRAVMIMYATEDIILDNVNIGGDGVLYAINTGETGPNGSAGIDLIVTNSTIKGWTSYGDAIESASFTNVSFGQGTYYNNIYGRVLKPYVNTTLTDCSFIEHMNLDLSDLKEGHKVTIENCTVKGQAVTADVFTIPSTDAEYDTKLFTVDLPSWATSISDCIIFK